MKDFIVVHDFEGKRTLVNTHNISHIEPYGPNDRINYQGEPFCDIWMNYVNMVSDAQEALSVLIQKLEYQDEPDEYFGHISYDDNYSHAHITCMETLEEIIKLLEQK